MTVSIFGAPQTTRRRLCSKSKTPTITKKGKCDNHLKSSLFSLVFPLLLIFCLLFFCISGEKRSRQRKIKKKEAATVAGAANKEACGMKVAARELTAIETM